MKDDRFVASLVETYDLSPGLKERIKWIASQRINELGLNTDEQYRYVSELIEKFTEPYRKPLSLDMTVYLDSDTTFHDIVGYKDQIHEDDEIDALSGKEILSILKGNVDESDLSMISDMFHQVENVHIHTSPQQIEENVETIVSKIEQLRKRYERGDVLILPPRPIISVSFGPLIIKFGRRRYGGNPLGYYLEHIDRYEGLGRSGLFYFDRGLYNALSDYGQLSEAIPEIKKTTISEEKKQIIIQAYGLSEANAVLASKKTNSSPTTVRRIWKKEGLESRENKLNDDEKVKILDAFHECNGNASLASRKLGRHTSTFSKYWRKAGLIEKRSWGKSLMQDHVEKVIGAYRVFSGSSTMAAKHLPYSHKTFLKYWRDAGLKSVGTHRGRHGLSEEKKKAVIDAYYDYDRSSVKAAKHLPYSQPTVLKYWKEAGLKTRRRWEHVKS